MTKFFLNLVLFISSAATVLLSPVAASAQTKMINGFNNVYSSHMEFINNRLKMYFGGWQTSTQRFDKIYRADCPHPHQPCKLESSVKFMVNGSWVDKVPDLEHVNDPSIVNMGGHLIMYMTACPARVNCLELSKNEIYYSVSWANDGIHWSKPVKIAGIKGWLPSAVRNPNGRVTLYYNSTVNGLLMATDMTASGVNPVASRATSTGASHYANVEIRYQPSIRMYQMLGEVIGASRIDYLHSKDGVNFIFGGTVARPTGSNIQIRTPAMHPHTASWMYYAQTASPHAMDNQIYLKIW